MEHSIAQGRAGRVLLSILVASTFVAAEPTSAEQQTQDGYHPGKHPQLPLPRTTECLNTARPLTGFRGAGNEVEYLRTRVAVLARTRNDQSALRSAAPARDQRAIEDAIRAASQEQTGIWDLP